jgi:multiple sugar transport system ATP-binding protein
LAGVSFEQVAKVYPGGISALSGFDLEISNGEFMVLVGPSGSGKSTSLRMLAGLEDVTAGHILIGGRDVTHLPPRDRDIAMVFQNYALYPHMTVADNMGFALKMAKVEKHERQERVREAAKLLDLEDYLTRKPRALSGGQRQRVAMGRAIVRRPQVFCMDEPLSNLDAKLRVATRSQIVSLQQRLEVTTVYVTHDQTEAMTMGDRIAVMDHGRLQQVGTPLDLYDRPDNIFVAGFIGSPAMNLFTGEVTDGTVHFGEVSVPVTRNLGSSATREVVVGVRPEGWRVGSDDEDPGTPEVAVPITVTLVEELGSEAFVYGTSDVAGSPQHVVVHADGQRNHHKGETLRLHPRPDRLHIFDAGTGTRLSS